MNEERDKFLTEQMDKCWHEELYRYDSFTKRCKVCDKDSRSCTRINFSTPDGFFKLWNWAKEQEWWEDWKESKEYRNLDGAYIINMEFFIHPDRFANAIYEFLKER